MRNEQLTNGVKNIYYETNHLPAKHIQDHNLCLYFHDICVSIFKKSIENCDITIIINDEEKESMELFKSDCVIDWMLENGYKDEAKKLLKRNIFNSLLMDFSHYILESLKTSELGKTSVSYTLLRKPLKDNLFYLEWLTYDSDELLSYVDEGKIELYEVGNMKRHYNKKMKRIIEYAFDNNPFKEYLNPNEVLGENYIYKVRYDYSSPNSLELIWNNSTHLVTTAPKIKSRDFNDLFINEEDLTRRWDYYYSKVPILLFYSTGLVINLYEKLFAELSEEEKVVNNQFIISRWLSKVDGKLGKEFLEIILQGEFVSIDCEVCGNFTKLNLNHLSSLQYEYFISCKGCGEPILMSRYLFIDN